MRKNLIILGLPGRNHSGAVEQVMDIKPRNGTLGKFSFSPIIVAELTDDDTMTTATPKTVSSPIEIKHVGQSKAKSCV